MKAYIYTIRSYQTDLIYIGSTTQSISRRMTGHRRDYKLWLDKKKNYITSCEILKYEDCYIELLQEVEVESKLELYRIEGENIRKHNCVNKCIAGRTDREWKQDNAKKITEYHTNYRQDNIVKIAEYRQNNAVKHSEQASKPYTCECDSIVRIGDKARHCKSLKHLKAIELKATTA